MLCCTSQQLVYYIALLQSIYLSIGKEYLVVFGQWSQYADCYAIPIFSSRVGLPSAEAGLPLLLVNGESDIIVNSVHYFVDIYYYSSIPNPTNYPEVNSMLEISVHSFPLISFTILVIKFLPFYLLLSLIPFTLFSVFVYFLSLCLPHLISSS